MASKLAEANAEKYDWLCLVLRLGHLHMNQLKTLFKVLDYIILQTLGKEASHLSLVKAYQYFVGAKDTHNTYQTLQILLNGTTAKFYLQCVQWCYEEKCMITSEGFLDWFSAIENETFGLVREIILNFVLAVYVQKLEEDDRR